MKVIRKKRVIHADKIARKKSIEQAKLEVYIEAIQLFRVAIADSIFVSLNKEQYHWKMVQYYNMLVSKSCLSEEEKTKYAIEQLSKFPYFSKEKA